MDLLQKYANRAMIDTVLKLVSGLTSVSYYPVGLWWSDGKRSCVVTDRAARSSQTGYRVPSTGAT